MRIPIRVKLAAALAVPLLALVGVAVFEVARADARATAAGEETALATAAGGPESVISRLQDERNFSLVELLGMTGSLQLPVANYEEARGATDAAVTDLGEFVDAEGGEVAAAFSTGRAAIDAQLALLRADIDAAARPSSVDFAQDVYARFAGLITVLIEDTAGIALDVEDADLRTGVELVSYITLDLEKYAEVSRGIFNHILAPNTVTVEQARLEVSELLGAFNANRDRILDRSTGPYERLPEEYLLTAEYREQIDHYERFVNTGETDLAALQASLSSDQVPGVVLLREDVTDVLEREAAAVVRDANDQRQLAVTVGVLMVGAALVITIFASRSITNPLRSLTDQAETMATETLPNAVQQVLDTPLGEDVVVPAVPPIHVRTRDEVADVADALNTVQASALDLAVEQAALRKNISDSYVNLGRRNQNLLDRQLELITDLERQEQEPERLEDLFRLDHLATRMRRNAESLLRLAGGGGDSSSWGGPVPVVDVVRGALGEIEGFQRVDVRSLPAATIAGSAGADLAHALAELVENALQFSPPDERVEVRGRRTEDGGYTLAVIDHGVGMPPEQLEIANRRLAGEESFTVAPSRYLGHYVAGYLGATHGIAISLEQEAAGGLTARLDVPALLVGEIDGGFAPPPPAEAVIEDEIIDDQVAVEDEVVRDEIIEDEVVRDEIIEDEVVRDEIIEDEIVPDEIIEDEVVVEDEIVADEPVEEPAPVRQTAPMPAPVLEPAVWTEDDRPPVVREPAANGFGPGPAGGVTPGGLARRVRGANAPSATNVAAAFGGGDGSSSVDSSADGVASFLSAFSGGVERGLSEAREEEEQ